MLSTPPLTATTYFPAGKSTFILGCSIPASLLGANVSMAEIGYRRGAGPVGQPFSHYAFVLSLSCGLSTMLLGHVPSFE